MLKIAIPAPHFNESDTGTRIIGTPCLIWSPAERGQAVYLQGFKAKIAQIAAIKPCEPLIACPLACI
ncbi:hypothetical protein [Phaeobacter sp. 11ANDIMAR09]|uniref:hypothetical protein n=1 Tax=Phaeobacter sp. 11ANDIMAR09 TaxID=1225647 RepID=UPI0006C8B6E1|nr:hypothetical protein [Phaeobacter sp. 11ANDIMAR09]KPD11693.1 hypothetical protein AN476_14700 [Phaeobacter sp. 11ANDIMAR09]